jgi:hypothetical protein
MLSLVVGFIVIAMGIKAMTPAGIPLTRKKRLHGFWAKVAGGFCLLLGPLMLVDGAWSLIRFGAQVAQVAGGPKQPAGVAQAAPQVDLHNWVRRRTDYTAPHGDFAILFPSAPTETNKRLTPTEGIKEDYS